MNLKKSLSFLLALLMLLPLSTAAFAEEYAGTFTVKTVFFDSLGNTADNLSLKPGESVRADVFFTSDFLAGSLKLGMQFESGVFELDSEKHIASGGEYKLLDTDPSLSGTFHIGIKNLPEGFDNDRLTALNILFDSSDVQKYDNLKAFSICFKVKSGASDGETGSFTVIPGSQITGKDTKNFPTGIDCITNESAVGTSCAKVSPDDILTPLDYSLSLNFTSGKVTVAESGEPGGDSNNDEEEFEKYKSEMSSAAGELEISGESSEGKKLISDAINSIGALKFDSGKTLDENKASVKAVVDKLKTDLDALRNRKYRAAFSDGGNIISETFYKEGETVVKPANPVKDGYTFKGWEPSVPEKMPASDMTFSAVFEKKSEPAPFGTYKLPSFKEQSAAYKTFVTVNVTLNNIPTGAEVYIAGKKAEKDNNTYSADIGQLKETTTVNIEVRSGDKTVAVSALTVKVSNGFFDKVISVIVNFIFNLFKWKRVNVAF